MAINDYRNIEFGIGIENGIQPDILYRLSINDSVREALHDMKETFDNHFVSFPDEPTRFELTEKYGASEHLIYPLIQNDLPDLFNLYSTSARIPLNDININDNLPLISYYFAIFTHNNGSKTIGVKRPTQFKGLLRKKIVKILNDSLIMVPDDLFKLDIDFDFFINETSIDILHPNGFLYISKIDRFTLQRAGEATNALALRINFINFAYIAPLVEQKIMAARLISSIKSRPDLEDTNEQKLLAKCALHGVIINQQNGLIAPQDDHLITFLQILDRRLYDYDLLDNNTEQYLASSRKRTT